MSRRDSRSKSIAAVFGHYDLYLTGENKMAGSKKYFEYTTDAGDIYAALLDESNTEAVNGADGDYSASSTVKYTIPGNVKLRFGLYANADRTRQIRCVCLTQATYNSLETTAGTIPDPIAASGTLTLVQKSPERLKLLPIAADTGQTDGDDT